MASYTDVHFSSAAIPGKDGPDENGRLTLYARDYGVRFGRFQDFRGVVGEDQAQKFGKRGAVRGEVA